MQTNDTKPCILYVDDEEENLLVFKATFRKNYHVLTAASAALGKEVLQETPVDLIISDQRMPETTGIDFLSSLPEIPENIRMILTGYSDMEAIIEALNSGKIYKYITKPWEKSSLQKVIDEALRQQAQNKKKREEIQKVKQEKEAIDLMLHSSPAADTDAVLQLELIRYKNEVEILGQQVAESDKNVQLLSEIGQEIIANLTIEGIIESTYENVNALMDANVFSIGVYDEVNEVINFPAVKEKGERLPLHSISIHNKEKPAAWTLRNKKEFFSNDYKNDFRKFFQGELSAMSGDLPESMLYLPLIAKEKTIGVISVQSFKKNAYTAYDLNILRNIAIYVATALENEKAYHVIEEHKKEIEQKNIELEHKVRQRTDQLQQQNDEMIRQKDELESTYRNVKLLSEIGQQITATLSLEKIIETVYENVNGLMDATIFGIGVFNSDENRLDFPGSMEKGVKLPFWFVTLDDENRIPIWCFKNQKEIIINDFQTEYNKYIKSIAKPKAGGQAESIIYLPLTTNEGPIGVITVQSFKKHLYNQYHIDILHSLGSYITIAIQNSASYRKMTQAFEDLKAAQMKLVESEKMASLGVLTAGVAHEINNPVNFISAGIDTLITNYADIKELFERYLQFDPEQNDKELWNEILRLRTALEPEEALPEIEQLLTSVKTGAQRTAEIVKGLRNFSRLDENDMKKARIEEGIDNTLVILNNRMKNRITIIKEYGDIPEIVCYPGQLNQVFMNLLHNASDAIEGDGTIHIKTWKDNGNVIVSIKDSGKGIPEEVRTRIFEPFFTTKPVGKGTGLGLSIAYGIIEKHKGNIAVESDPGKGTRFTITLPLN